MVNNVLRAWSDGTRPNVTFTGVGVTVTVEPRVLVQGVPGGIIVAPRAGKVRRLYARVELAPGVGNSHSFTLFRNGLITALTATVTGVAFEAQDLVNEVAVVAGDKLEIVHGLVGGNQAGAMRVEVEFA